MPFIKADMGDAREDELCPEAEYDLSIITAETRKSKNSGKPMIACMIRIDNPPEDISLPAPIFHYITLPVGEDAAAELGIEPDDKETYQRKLRDMRRFLVAFNIPFSSEGFDDETLIGAQGSAMVAQREGQSGEMEHNLRLPRATDEQAAGLMGAGTAGKGKGSRRRGTA